MTDSLSLRMVSPATHMRQLPIRKLMLLAFVTVNFSALLGFQASAADEGLPTLTRAEQVRELSVENANRGYPVHLRGVATFVDDFALFVQDSSAGIAVIASGLTRVVRAGELIELDGITECPDFAPQITSAKVRVVGPAQMPKSQACLV